MEGSLLYIGGFEPPDKNAAAQRVWANSLLFESLGMRVILLGVSESTASLSKNSASKFLTYMKQYPSKLFQWFIMLVSIKEVKSIVKNVKKHGEIKLIVAYNYPAIALLRLYFYTRRKNLKLIADCTEWSQVENPGYIKEWIKNFDTALRMRYIHAKLDGIIVISRYLKDYYSKKMSSVLLLPPLVNKCDEKWTYEGVIIPQDKIVIVYAGSPGNGGKDRLDLIVKALSSISEKTNLRYELKIIGIDKTQYLKDFDQESIPANLESKLSFMGKIPHTQALVLLKNAHYSIFVRDKNRITNAGFPTKFVESISCGTPVLTNNSSNITDYLMSGENGFLLGNVFADLSGDLQLALEQRIEKIMLMKNVCKSTRVFDYSNYAREMSVFLRQIEVL